MGALLSAAVPRLRCPEEANLRAPDAVVSLHVSFINAGAELIETNTFGANRRKLGHHFLEDDLERINSVAVKLARDAREVTGRDVFVAGSIGPIGEPLASRLRRDIFGEQASILEGRGADLFMLETFYDLGELVDAVESVRSTSSLPIVALLTFDERELVVSLGEEQRETGLARALREHEWVVSVQLDPPLGGSSAGLVDVARGLAESGHVGFVDINDNATARAGMNSLMVSATIERECGLETIPHLTTRDWSVMGMESLLLGAHAEGVRNILAITGDPPEVGDYPGSRGVYEVDSVGLTQLMANLNRAEDFNGRPIDAPTSFFPGVAVNPTPDDIGVKIEHFHRKVEAGAKFAITQIVFVLEPS